MPDGSILVQKYGGSSVATPEQIRAVARHVVRTREAGHALVVVVSAMGGSTDGLLELARQVCGQPCRRELDMLLSVGERITMALLSMAVKDLGHEAISFTGSQCGILTDDRHFDARIIEVRPFRVVDELERGRVVIVAGYQGASYRREVTTLGRGGSDTTAVALAAALGAEACEIYSDVDGVYSADPRTVSGATHIEEVGYGEMATLARAGARVLNEEAVRIAREQGVAIYARATADPEGRCTVVRRDLPTDATRVASVTSRRGLTVLRGVPEGSPSAVAAQLLAQGALCTSWSTQSDGQLECWADPGDVQLSPVPGLSVVPGRSSVSVVGAGVGRDPALVERVHTLLAEAEVPVEAAHANGAEITLLLATPDPVPAVRLLHHELIERPLTEGGPAAPFAPPPHRGGPPCP